MAEASNCGNCAFRAKFDARPKSFLGRLWRWHADFCPGWRGYMTGLPETERRQLEERYGFPAGKFGPKAPG
jgi:hypothetical protein